MKILVALNFAVGLLLAIAMVVLDDFDLAELLIAGPLLMCFLGLAIVNFVYVFTAWKRFHMHALIPVGTYLMALMLTGLGLRLEANWVLKGTPCRPETFFTNQVKSELTQVGQAVLASQYKDILPSETVALLHKYNLKVMFVDREQGIVELAYWKGHTWFNYVWSKNGLPHANAMPPDLHPVETDLGNNWYFYCW